MNAMVWPGDTVGAQGGCPGIPKMKCVWPAAWGLAGAAGWRGPGCWVEGLAGVAVAGAVNVAVGWAASDGAAHARRAIRIMGAATMIEPSDMAPAVALCIVGQYSFQKAAVGPVARSLVELSKQIRCPTLRLLYGVHGKHHSSWCSLMWDKMPQGKRISRGA